MKYRLGELMERTDKAWRFVMQKKALTFLRDEKETLKGRTIEVSDEGNLRFACFVVNHYFPVIIDRDEALALAAWIQDTFKGENE